MIATLWLGYGVSSHPLEPTQEVLRRSDVAHGERPRDAGALPLDRALCLGGQGRRGAGDGVLYVVQAGPERPRRIGTARTFGQSLGDRDWVDEKLRITSAAGGAESR